MKKPVFIFLLCFMASGKYQAHAQGWTWAFHSTSGLDVTSLANDKSDFYSGFSAVDRFGNLFITGSTSEPNDPGVNGNYTVLGHDTIYNFGNHLQLIIAKQDAGGNIVFTVYTQYCDAKALGIVVDSVGCLFLWGIYNNNDSLKIGPVTISNPTANFTYFLAKISPMGDVLWAKNTISCDDTISTYSPSGGIGIDGSGSLYVAGNYDRKFQIIGVDTLYNKDTSGNTCDVFLAKYDSAGNPVWAKTYGGTDMDNVLALGVTNKGNVYTAGYYTSDTFVVGNDTLFDSFEDTITYNYFVKFDTAGNVAWAKRGKENVGIIVTDDNENAYVTTGFDTVGSLLTKYDPSGNVKWVKTGGEDLMATSSSIAVDHCGNIWLCGDMGYPSAPPLNFDGHLIASPTNFYPLFIIQLDTSGNYFNSMTFSTGGDGSTTLATDNKGDLYVYGNYNYYSMAFGHDTLNPDSSFHSAWEIYTAKFVYDSFECDPYHFPTQVEPLHVLSPDIFVYPNPAYYELNIVSSVDITAITITNILGQQVSNYIYNSKSVKVDIADLPEGIYLVKINGMEIRKFIKQ